MDDLQITYGSDTDINCTWDPQTFYGKFKQFDFSVVSPRTLHIRGECHKDITDGTDVFTDEKYLVTCCDPGVHPAMCNWGLSNVKVMFLRDYYVHL